MCGRYRLDTSRAELQRVLNSWLRQDDGAWLAHYAPRDLIRPHEPVLAMRREHGEDRLSHMLWGLLPAGSKTHFSHTGRLTHARKPLLRRPPFAVRGVITAVFFPARVFLRRGI